MSGVLHGLPARMVTVDLSDASVGLRVDAQIYPLEVVYAAAYIFIDRCYVFLDRPTESELEVVLSSRDSEVSEEQLRVLVGELANQLVSCAWQQQIFRDNRLAIESVTMQAMVGALGKPSLDDLEDFDFTDEALDDPLGIAMSWEEKYGKKAKAPKATSGAGAQEPT